MDILVECYKMAQHQSNGMQLFLQIPKLKLDGDFDNSWIQFTVNPWIVDMFDDS